MEHTKNDGDLEDGIRIVRIEKAGWIVKSHLLE